MDKLVHPWKEEYWFLFIKQVTSTAEIWGSLIGPEYSVSYINSKNVFLKKDVHHSLGVIYLRFILDVRSDVIDYYHIS